MPIQLFNTLTRQVEIFQPMDPAGKVVKMYTCGPTVYSFAHIGNFRAYVFEDLLHRHLEARGYIVDRVLNLTDVDDKTIRGSHEANIPLSEFTRNFKLAFFEDLAALRIKPADHSPAATDSENVAKMIEMIGILVEKGIAYQAEDRSVYFRINRFADYGKLAHLNLEELRPSGRVRSDNYEKENLGDFALWKAWDEEDGHVGWESPWGRGRPGWHIECSAMANRLLGAQIDIHCGGVDNIFPHHEAEIAQSESCTGQKFVRYWLHCAHLLVDGQKMSKSLGNFYTLRDLFDKSFTGREVRYALLQVNYRLPLNFTFDGLIAARQALLRLDEWVRRLRELAITATPTQSSAAPEPDPFFMALDDDLNISAALAELFERVRASNRAMDQADLTPAGAAALLQWWEQINRVLQLHEADDVAPPAMWNLVRQREQARQEKDWPNADKLRYEIESRGWVVKDTKDGPKLSKKAG
jgi:cysteinyl-tRNA synthetase